MLSCTTGTSAFGRRWCNTGPRPVVQAPIETDARARRTEELHHPLGQGRVAWRRVLHREELVGKAAEVVDRLWSIVAGQERAGHEPVRRHAQDGFRRGDEPASARNPWLQVLSSMAFIGEPWPTNRTGIRAGPGAATGWDMTELLGAWAARHQRRQSMAGGTPPAARRPPGPAGWRPRNVGASGTSNFQRSMGCPGDHFVPLPSGRARRRAGEKDIDSAAMRQAPPRRLLARLLWGTLAPTLLALTAFGPAGARRGRRVLEDELGRRLALAAAGTAGMILPEQMAALADGRRRLADAAKRPATPGHPRAPASTSAASSSSRPQPARPTGPIWSPASTPRGASRPAPAPTSSAPIASSSAAPAPATPPRHRCSWGTIRCLTSAGMPPSRTAARCWASRWSRQTPTT